MSEFTKKIQKCDLRGYSKYNFKQPEVRSNQNPMEGSKGWSKLLNDVVLCVAVFQRCYLPVFAVIGWWSLCCIIWTYFPSPLSLLVAPLTWTTVCLALTSSRESVCCAGGSMSCVLHPSLNNLYIFPHIFSLIWLWLSSAKLSHLQWSDLKFFCDLGCKTCLFKIVFENEQADNFCATLATLSSSQSQ